LTVDRSEWKGEVTETKGMDYRVVPMTRRLQEVLSRHRHLKGDRVLYTDVGESMSAKVLQVDGRSSRLAGNKNLRTTLRYMHRSPGETDRAIRLLDGPALTYEMSAEGGDIVETATVPPANLRLVNQ